MTLSMVWPIALIVISNIFYNVCTKSTPEGLDPFASLTVTYLVGALAAAVMYFILHRGGNLFAEYTKINWSVWVLGLSIVGLEAGNIYMYKAGWTLGTGQIVHSALLALCLIVIGVLFYKEQISATKIVGAVVCLAGLYLINR